MKPIKILHVFWKDHRERFIYPGGNKTGKPVFFSCTDNFYLSVPIAKSDLESAWEKTIKIFFVHYVSGREKIIYIGSFHTFNETPGNN